MKLSRLQTDWQLETWAAFFVAFTAFWAVFQFADSHFGKKPEKEAPVLLEKESMQGLFEAILILTAVSLGAFLLEAAVLGYVPFFLRGVPHAYS